MLGFAAKYAIFGVLLAAGCEYSFDRRAQSAYSEGRYLETAERLERHEREVNGLTPERQARYGLYRGLALLRLGDAAAARRWLAFTYECEKLAPTLGSEQRALLDAGWQELTRQASAATAATASAPR